MPFEDDILRNSMFTQKQELVNSVSKTFSDSKDDSVDRIEEIDQLQHEYAHRCLLWIANANSIVICYLLKLISNLFSHGQNKEHIEETKSVLRNLMKGEESSALFGAMLEGNDMLAFYFRVIMKLESPHDNSDAL